MCVAACVPRGGGSGVHGCPRDRLPWIIGWLEKALVPSCTCVAGYGWWDLAMGLLFFCSSLSV